jgi:hypothetical protein
MTADGGAGRACVGLKLLLVFKGRGLSPPEQFPPIAPDKRTEPWISVSTGYDPCTHRVLPI